MPRSPEWPATHPSSQAVTNPLDHHSRCLPIHEAPFYQDGDNGGKTPEGDDARPDVEDGAPRAEAVCQAQPGVEHAIVNRASIEQPRRSAAGEAPRDLIQRPWSRWTRSSWGGLFRHDHTGLRAGAGMKTSVRPAEARLRREVRETAIRAPGRARHRTAVEGLPLAPSKNSQPVGNSSYRGSRTRRTRRVEAKVKAHAHPHDYH